MSSEYSDELEGDTCHLNIHMAPEVDRRFLGQTLKRKTKQLTIINCSGNVIFLKPPVRLMKKAII